MTIEMKKTQNEDSPRANSTSEDLSYAIQQSVTKLAGEVVRCTRLWGDRYRCNWWRRTEDDALTSGAGRIVRSRFLKAVQTPDGLIIEDLTA